MWHRHFTKILALGSSLARQFFSNQIRVRKLLNKFSPTIQDHINLLLAFGALHFIEQRNDLPITYFNLSHYAFNIHIQWFKIIQLLLQCPSLLELS